MLRALATSASVLASLRPHTDITCRPAPLIDVTLQRCDAASALTKRNWQALACRQAPQPQVVRMTRPCRMQFGLKQEPETSAAWWKPRGSVQLVGTANVWAWQG